MNGAEAAAKCLELEGVKTIFGYPGVAICPVFDALLNTNIHCVLVRSEANAAHAASGVSRISGRSGVAICTSGPGAANLITGIATAYADSIPLICITGQVDSSLIGGDVFQEADITGAVESFVKYSYLVRNPNDIPRIFKEAFYIANTGRRGPVLIDIPEDIQRKELKDFKYPEEVNLRTYKPTHKGNAAQIKKIKQALENAKRPLICVGGGVHWDGAASLVLQFAEQYKIPVVATMMGISAMPSRHELYMGMLGNNGGLAANKAIRESDLIMLVGARLADRAINNPKALMADKYLIHIDVDPAEIGKNAPVSLPIVGDAKAVMTDILELLSDSSLNFNFNYQDDKDAWIKNLREFRLRKTRRVPLENRVDPALFVRTLSLAMGEHSTYVADVGQNQIWSCSNVVMQSGSRFLTSGGMGTMGYAIPAAVGAKMADKNSKVAAVIGDGGFQMCMCELATIMQEKLDIKICIINNGALGMVREYQHFACHDRFTMVRLNGVPKINKLAEAYDMAYMSISSSDSTQSISDKINSMLNHNGPVIMEVFIDEADIVRK